MQEELLALQESIYKYHSDLHLEYLPRISFSKIGSLYEITFYGEGYDDDHTVHSSKFEPHEFNFAFCALQDFLVEHPEKILSLKFTGPDSGANGIKSWNFNRLIHSNATFQNLASFEVVLTNVADHNQSCIGEFDEENGMIAKLVEKMPKLISLQLPTTPDIDFFNLPELCIENLVIQAGHDHKRFIHNLSQATNLNNLKSLDYSEPFDYFGDMDDDQFTSFSEFKKLFESNLFSYPHFHFKLRENQLTKTQLEELQRVKKVQLLHIKTETGKYVRI